MGAILCVCMTEMRAVDFEDTSDSDYNGSEVHMLPEWQVLYSSNINVSITL
jgi:hypothetical protein